MALDDQRFKDHCLIIVGNGGKADEVLAKRRLAAGGRLAHFLTRPNDPRVTFSASADCLEHDFFTWQPPKGAMGVSCFARKLQGKPRTFWTKTGPPGFQKVLFFGSSRGSCSTHVPPDPCDVGILLAQSLLDSAIDVFFISSMFRIPEGEAPQVQVLCTIPLKTSS